MMLISCFPLLQSSPIEVLSMFNCYFQSLGDVYCLYVYALNAWVKGKFASLW